MVNPTGDNVTPVQTPNVTAAGWTRIDNPNMAQQVDVTAAVDLYVRYEQFEPLPAATGFRVWGGTYYPYRTSHWLGWHKYRNPVDQAYIPDDNPTYAPVWVRLVAAGTETVDTNWIRE